MKPDIGQYVKCLLINNLIVEGYVEGWSDLFVKIKSPDDNNILIIHHPERDIVLTKIVLQTKKEIITSSKEKLTNLEKEFEQEYTKSSDDNLRIKKLADLKVMIAEQDKKIITDKLKDHHISETRIVKYGYPGFFQKPRT